MSISRITLDTFMAITCDDAYANLALKDAEKLITDERDMRFTRALIYTALEHLSYIDYVMAFFAEGKQNKIVKGVLRLGLAQILYMKRPKNAVCNESVNLTKEVGKSALSGYVNAVLRNACRAYEAGALPELPSNEKERLKTETGYPEWIITEYIERFGYDTAEAVFNAKADGISVRVQYPYSADEFEAWCVAEKVKYARSRFDENVFRLYDVSNITDTELFMDGKITVQSESSAIVCRACGIKSGMNVLDACAAPGGKSAYIAALSENKCEILACEIHEHRAELIRNTLGRLNVTCVKTQVQDSSKYNADLAEKFDIVLCDVPCSGLGVLGKPDIRYRKDACSVDEITTLQRAIINNCAKYVKPNGKLVYSTCTVSLRENENVIADFLNRNNDFEMDFELAEILPECLKERAEGGMLHILPNIDGTDGFFVARLKKKGLKSIQQ